jgi:hypothetical protein
MSGDRAQIASWLSQVHAKLPAPVFKFAFALSQAVDEAGWIATRTVKSLFQPMDNEEVTAGGDLLGELVASGHLTRKAGGYRVVYRGRAFASANMIAFPASRRVGEIRRLAKQMLELPPARAESHLFHQLRLKGDTMRRRGIGEREADRQLKMFEAGVRAELWRLVIKPFVPPSK